MNRGRAVLFVAMTCGWIFSGCGEPAKEVGPTGTVSGTVTFDGSPVTEGRVQLYSQSTGEGGATTLDAQGAFRLEEPLPVGAYSVFVLPPPEPAPSPDVAYEPKEYPNIPEKYRSEMTTDLKVEVAEGENTFPIEMKP